MTSLAMLLSEAAAQYPTRPAVRHDGRVLTYAELDEASARVTALLVSRGVGPGPPVGLMMPTSPSSPSSTTGSCGPERSSCR